MKQHFATFGVFCAAYVISAIILAIFSAVFEVFLGAGIAFEGVLAAFSAALITGIAFARWCDKAPSVGVGTAYALAMCVYVGLVSMVLKSLMSSSNAVTSQSDFFAGVFIPLMVALYFVVLRIGFPLGARIANRRRVYKYRQEQAAAAADEKQAPMGEPEAA